jgi:PAS domain S-box-containing protein
VVSVPVLALLIVLFFSLIQHRRSEQIEEALGRGLQVRTAMRQALGLLVDAETGVRGYLLTGDRAYLEPYRNARRELPGAWAGLADALAGAHGPVGATQALARRRLEILERLAQTGPAEGEAAAGSLTRRLDRGKAVMDEVRVRLGRLDAEVQSDLDRRRAAAERLDRMNAVVIAAGMVLGLGGGLLAMLLFVSGVARRVERLQFNARQLENPDSLPEWPRETDEIGQLGRSLEETSALLAARRRELEDSKAFLEDLITSTPGVIYRTSPTGAHPTFLSPNVNRVLGLEADERITTADEWLERVEAEDRAFLSEMATEAVARKSPMARTEVRVAHKDGSIRLLSVLVSFDYDSSGRLESILAYGLDVTEEKEAAEALKRAKDEAERANREKSEFLSRMSHELRTPLNAILGFGQLLEMDELSSEQKESVKQVMSSGRHLLDLIDEVLDISRIESGTMSISTEPVLVEEIIAECLDMVRPLAGSKSVTIYSDAMMEPTHVLADRHRLKQVLLNLLSNAIKYNGKKGSVTVSCQTRALNKLRVTVRDTGRGIGKEKMARLFTPFDRLGAEETGVAGTGLGLALSRRLVEVMGGTLGAESVVGDGSTFWVDLNLTSDPVAAHDVVGGAREPQLGIDADVVLYIEDNLSNMRLVERLLAHRTPVQLVPAMKGRLGLELAREHRPDLILLDVHLPDITGEEVLEQLQADEATRAIPVVVISADATTAQRRRLLDVGARHYLTKPLDLELFLDVVVTTLSERVPAQSPVPDVSSVVSRRTE